MSTRCQIEFQNFWKDDKGKEHLERRTIYRHSDGYPEGVIPDLKEFLKWNKGRNNDVEYTTANFVYWSKRWHEQNYFNKDLNEKIENKNLKWSDNQLTNCSILHIGFGICENDEFHGDIEYFYEVINKDKTIKIKAYKVDRENWDEEITKKNMKFIKQTIVKGVV
jgi:hypothetical protein